MNPPTRVLRFLCLVIGIAILGSSGQKLFGLTGMLLGSLAGSVVGWWGAKRLMPY